MDTDPRPTAEFVPDQRYTVLAALGAFAALAAAVLSDDRPGRVLFTIAALVLAGYVAADFVFRPRLTASAAGLVVNTPFTRAVLSWDDVRDVRADTRFRRGLRSVTLEIDADPVLVVFTRRTLGVEPDAAARAIEAMRPR